jgi:uncharacterized protein YidB (DUF937 family)
MASSRTLALLGLLAVAGYQNRDKLAEMLGKITNRPASPVGKDAQTTPGANPGAADSQGGLLGGLLGGGSGGIAGTLGEIVDHFTKAGQSDAVHSWVSTGANSSLTETQLESALGEDSIEQLVNQTGLSRQELLSRLKTVLPTAVDKLTPEGRVPTAAEAANWTT